MDRLCFLEDASEMPLLQPHWFKLCRVDQGADGTEGMNLDRLLAEALRLRPDRIVVGEVRHGEAQAFWRTLITSHVGACTTMHAAEGTWSCRG